MLRSLLHVLAAACMAVVLLSGSIARAQDPAVATRCAELDAILLDQGNAPARAKAVHVLAELGTADAARALVERLNRLAERKASAETLHTRSKEEYAPYEGFTFTDPKAWDIKRRLREELDKQAEGLVADSLVLRAFGMACSKFSDPAANKVLEREITASPNALARSAVLRGLLLNALVAPAEIGKKGMKDKDPTVRLVVLDALAERKSPETLDLGIKALQEDGWPHRLAASRLLGELGDVRAVAPLVNAMATDEGRMIEVYSAALAKITGAEIGAFADAWKSWYDEHKDELAAQGAKPQKTKSRRGGSDEGIDYYGIETKSRRICFLIDVSGSMNEPIGDPEAEITGKEQEVYNGLKVDIAVKVLKQAIRNLPEEAYFNIIVFNHEVKVFEKALIQATQDNKNKAFLMLNDLKASGSTFTYGALEKAFDLAGRGVTDKAYDPGVDTIFVLSDGAPTNDDVDKTEPMEPAKVTDAVAEWNGLSRITIHTIAIDPRIGSGGKGFVRFMKSLAAQNGGTYTEIGGDGTRSGGGKD